ncbi:MAG TPA: hypothetical protein ENI76_00280, partial [Ignavibacteria bacterium]|nr:hypothetical protein [Ignavibacteria bacterium]
MYQVIDIKGKAPPTAFANGVMDAVDDGVKVINYSAGGPYSPIYSPAIQYAKDHNVLIIISAGINNLGSVDYPAALSTQFDNIIAVSATNVIDQIANFSSIGNEVTIAAPGDQIYSTILLGLTYGGGHNGTSFSAPYVTGVASLMYSVNSNLLPPQVKDILEKTTLDIGDYGKDNYFGYGRLDAYRAVKSTQILNTYPGSKFITSSKSS